MDGMGALAVLILVAVVGVLLAGLAVERYRPRHAPVHPLPTSEVFIDPETHRRTRVWVDPVTGARDYRDEPDPTGTPLPPLERPGLFLPAQQQPALPAPPEQPQPPV
jgi:hypothetical protein